MLTTAAAHLAQQCIRKYDVTKRAREHCIMGHVHWANNSQANHIILDLNDNLNYQVTGEIINEVTHQNQYEYISPMSQMIGRQ